MGLFKWLTRKHNLKFSLLTSGDLTTLERVLKCVLIVTGINFITNLILLILFT